MRFDKNNNAQPNWQEIVARLIGSGMYQLPPGWKVVVPASVLTAGSSPAEGADPNCPKKGRRE